MKAESNKQFKRLFIKYICIIIIILTGFFYACSVKQKVSMDNLRFVQLENELAEITDSAQRQTYVDDFIQSLDSKNYPIFENDSTVVSIYQTSEKSAYIIGDMAESSFLPLQKIANTDLFYIRASYEPQARLEYWLTSNPDSIAGVDPLNPYTVYNGFGPMSELAMPLYQRHPYFNDYI